MSAATNGVRTEWRDVTAARLALREPEKVKQRQDIARGMLADGAKFDAIRDATREATGTAIGAGTLVKLRRATRRSSAGKKAAATRAQRRRRMAAAEAPSVESRVAGTHLGALVGVTEALEGLTNAQALKVLRMAAAYVEGGSLD